MLPLRVAHLPEGGQADGQAERSGAISPFQRPGKGGAQVVSLEVEAVEGSNLLGTVDGLLRRGGPLPEPGRMSGSQLSVLTSPRQCFQPELTNRFQHGEARLAEGSLRLPKEALVHQGGQIREDVEIT